MECDHFQWYRARPSGGAHRNAKVGANVRLDGGISYEGGSDGGTRQEKKTEGAIACAPCVPPRSLHV